MTTNATKWSKYQTNIFKEVSLGKDNVFVQALAGSGKTTTLIESIKYVKKPAKVLVVAFNKAIQEELSKRINSFFIDISTLHSFGLKSLKNKFSDIKVENLKGYRLAEKNMHKQNREMTEEVVRAVSMCKRTLKDTKAGILDLMVKYDISNGIYTEDDFVDVVQKTLFDAKKDLKEVDFDEMIWMNIVHNLSVPKYDVIFIDEAQDLGVAQIALIRMAAHAKTRFIFFGDINQAIYSFMGADAENVVKTMEVLNCKALPLSISYRCPKLVIKEAQRYVPHIEAAPDATDGVVENITIDKMIKIMKPGDFIISRTNAPLIKYCMQFLKQGIACNVRGKDIGKNLKSLVMRSKAKTIPTLIKYIVNWRDKEIAKLQLQKKAVGYIEDKAETLLNLCEDIKDIKELTSKLDHLFNDDNDNNKINLMSVHKSKGLQANNIFIFDWTLNKTGDQDEQNICYVAQTRSQKSLYYVNKS